jgi:WD40 repeat protein
LATGSADKTVILWDVTDPAHPARAGAFTDRGSVQSVAFSPRGGLLATASADSDYVSFGSGGVSLSSQAVILWDVTNPAHPARAATLVDSRRNLSGFAYGVGFGPDGRLLAAVSSDKAVTLWDVTDSEHPAETATLAISSHWLGPWVHAVAFSPAGRLLATGSDYQTVTLWDVTDPTRPARAATLAGQGGRVHTMGFSPGGQLLAAGGPDQTVQLWRVS